VHACTAISPASPSSLRLDRLPPPPCRVLFLRALCARDKRARRYILLVLLPSASHNLI